MQLIAAWSRPDPPLREIVLSDCEEDGDNGGEAGRTAGRMVKGKGNENVGDQGDNRGAGS